MISWPDLRWGDVPRNQEFIDRALEELDRFWVKNVQADTPPDPCPSDQDRKVLNRLHPNSGTTVIMTPEIEELCLELNLVTADYKAKEKRAKQLSNDLRKWMLEKHATKAINETQTIAYGYKRQSDGKVVLRSVKPHYTK
jgi:predicted phage-related endonuclease